MKRTYIGLIHKEPNSDYGVSFPRRRWRHLGGGPRGPITSYRGHGNFHAQFC